MGKIARTRHILYLCLDILLRDKSLMLFPMVSGVVGLLIFMSFLPFWDQSFWKPLAAGKFDTLSGAPSVREIVEYLKMFLFYFCGYFTTTFFNVGLLCCVLRHKRGEEAGFVTGLEDALAHVRQIAGWALIAAFVGVILRIVQSRSRSLAVRLGVGIVGVAFSLLSFLVVPVMVVQNKGPLDALKESGALFKKTWGERLISGLAFGIFGLILMFPAFVLIACTVVAETMGMRIALLAAAGLYMYVFILFQSALETIFRLELYHYAATGKISDDFDADLFKGAFEKDTTGAHQLRRRGS